MKKTLIVSLLLVLAVSPSVAQNGSIELLAVKSGTKVTMEKVAPEPGVDVTRRSPAGPKASGPTDQEIKKFGEERRAAAKLYERADKNEVLLERALERYLRLLEKAKKQDFGGQSEARLNFMVARVHEDLCKLTGDQDHRMKAITHYERTKRLLQDAPKDQRAVLQWLDILQVSRTLKNLRRE